MDSSSSLMLCNYRKVMSPNTSRLEAHAGFFQSAYEGDFSSLCSSSVVVASFGQKVDFLISKGR